MSISRRAVLAAGTAGSFSLALGTPGWAQSPAFGAGVDLAAQASLSSGACPGIAVLIGRQGEPLYARNYGKANLETDSPVEDQSVFRIASLTKQFAAAAALKLASQGALDLDEPVQNWLPAFASVERFTVRELMNHTAGLSDAAASSGAAAAEAPRSSVAIADEIARQPHLFDFPPGTAWLYGNANYKVLGAVIEQVTGQPLAVAMEALIFEPLALRTLAFDQSRDVVANRTSGYVASGDAGERFHNAPLIEIAEAGAAGAMRGTAADLLRWHHLLLNGGLLDAAHIQAMLTPGRLRDGRLSGANRFSPQDAGYGDTQYALGLLVSSHPQHGPVVQHYGYIEGFSACLETYMDSQVTIVVLCNGGVGPDLPFRGIRRAVLGAMPV